MQVVTTSRHSSAGLSAALRDYLSKLSKALVCSLSLLLILNSVSSAKEWRGITPLHSTRADVIRLLGQPDDKDDGYEVSEGRVLILYAAQPCERLFGVRRWNVPADTVLEITLDLKKAVHLKDLHLDTEKFKEHPAHYGQGSYRDDKEGIAYNLWFSLMVSSITYYPGESDANLLCKEDAR